MFNQTLLDVLSKEVAFKQVCYWSDGAGSQFKNRFNLSNAVFHHADFGIEATWNLFKTAHGKGAVDGGGGEVKRAVWQCTPLSKDSTRFRLICSNFIVAYHYCT